MKILKLIKNTYGHYSVIFDEIPKLTYEKIGCDYVGSYEENGKIIFSNYLKKDSYGGAFGGREISLNMKDGTIQTIKDYWFDYGSYEKHGNFIDIGAGTLKDLQKCYVYCAKNINKEAFEEMINEYLTRDKIYDDYREIENWCKLQYTWYPVIVRGKRIPFMMNKYGDMVERESKKRVYPRYNKCKSVKGKYKTYTYFRFEYKKNDKIIKIEDNYFEVLRNTLPFSKEEIIINCNLKESYINMDNKTSTDFNKQYKGSEIIAMIEDGILKNNDIISDKEKDEVEVKYFNEDTIDYLLEQAPFTIKQYIETTFEEALDSLYYNGKIIEVEYDGKKESFSDNAEFSPTIYQIKEGKWRVLK